MITKKEFFEKLATNKRFVVLLAVGVLLVFLSGTFEKKDNVIKNKSYENTNYCVDEEKLSGILSKVSGAGKVEVYISYLNTGEKVIAYDSDKDEKVAVNWGSDNEPYVITTKYPVIKGVLVVAEGAGDENVKNRLLKCVKAITDIPYSNICIEIKKK